MCSSNPKPKIFSLLILIGFMTLIGKIPSIEAQLDYKNRIRCHLCSTMYADCHKSNRCKHHEPGQAIDKCATDNYTESYSFCGKNIFQNKIVRWIDDGLTFPPGYQDYLKFMTNIKQLKRDVHLLSGRNTPPDPEDASNVEKPEKGKPNYFSGEPNPLNRCVRLQIILKNPNAGFTNPAQFYSCACSITKEDVFSLNPILRIIPKAGECHTGVVTSSGDKVTMWACDDDLCNTRDFTNGGKQCKKVSLDPPEAPDDVGKICNSVFLFFGLLSLLYLFK